MGASQDAASTNTSGWTALGRVLEATHMYEIGLGASLVGKLWEFLYWIVVLTGEHKKLGLGKTAPLVNMNLG